MFWLSHCHRRAGFSASIVVFDTKKITRNYRVLNLSQRFRKVTRYVCSSLLEGRKVQSQTSDLRKSQRSEVRLKSERQKQHQRQEVEDRFHPVNRSNSAIKPLTLTSHSHLLERFSFFNPFLLLLARRNLRISSASERAGSAGTRRPPPSSSLVCCSGGSAAGRARHSASVHSDRHRRFQLGGRRAPAPQLRNSLRRSVPVPRRPSPPEHPNAARLFGTSVHECLHSQFFARPPLAPRCHLSHHSQRRHRLRSTSVGSPHVPLRTSGCFSKPLSIVDISPASCGSPLPSCCFRARRVGRAPADASPQPLFASTAGPSPDTA